MFGLFDKKKIYERLRCEINDICTYHCRKVDSATLTNNRKKVLTGLLSCANFYSVNLINLVEKDPKLYPLIEKNPNVLEAFTASCCVVLNHLNKKIADQMAAKEHSDWVIPGFSRVLGFEEGFFINFINQYQYFVERGEDPRDLWLKQDIEFCRIFLRKDFNVVHHYKENYAELMTFSLASQELRILVSDLFKQEAY